ncbi:MAG: hypothetical protein ACLFPI_10150 [Desulfobacterales bacterium]
MTKKQRQEYRDTEELRKILAKALRGKKFILDCGHHITFGYHLGNDITIYNGRDFKITCSECGY